MDRKQIHRVSAGPPPRFSGLRWRSSRSPLRPAHAQDQPRKVVLRFVADFPPPPHPAALR